MVDYITDIDNEDSFLDDDVLEHIKTTKNVDNIDNTTENEEPIVEELFDDETDLITGLENSKGFRRTIPGYPLDHSFKCEHCEYSGKVGFRQRLCPRCAKTLIPPEDVEIDR